MTQIICSMRGIECGCGPNECRAAPPRRLDVINANCDEALTTANNRALDFFWRSFAVAIVLSALSISIFHALEVSKQQALIDQEVMAYALRQR